MPNADTISPPRRSQLLRDTLAFLVAPMTPLVAVSALAIAQRGPSAIGEALWGATMVGIFIYPIAILVGLPVYLLLLRLRWTALSVFAAAGAGIGLAVCQLYLGGRFLPAWIGLLTICGAFATTCFWLIARPDRRAAGA